MPRRPTVIALLVAVVLGLAACGDEAPRVDDAEEPTILEPNVDEIVTEAP